jgi:hypothetical protein
MNLILAVSGLAFNVVGTLFLGFDAIKLLFVGMNKQIDNERVRRHDTSPRPRPGTAEFNVEYFMLRQEISGHRNPVAAGFMLLVLGFGLQIVALFV